MKIRSSLYLYWILICAAECIFACVAKDPIPPNAADIIYFLVYSFMGYSAFFAAAGLGFDVFAKLIPGIGKKPGARQALASSLLAATLWTIFSYIKCRSFLVSKSIFFGNPIFFAAFLITFALAGVIAVIVYRKSISQSGGSGAVASKPTLAIAALLVFCVMYYHLNILKIWDTHITKSHIEESGKDMPNVVLITLDTVSSIHSDFDGEGKNSPTMKELAATGVGFPDTTASMPLTGPSHASILTGLIPQHHGVLKNTDILLDDFTTITEVLKKNGYETAVFMNMLSGVPEYNFTQGFDTIYTAMEGNSAVRYKLNRLDLFLLVQRISKPLIDLKLLPYANYENLWLALNWLKKAPEKPFFFWFHTYLAHAPYAPTEDIKEMFGVAGARNWSVDDNFAQTDSGTMLPQEKIKEITGLYHGDIYMADTCVKEIVKVLKDRNLIEKTLLVVTADHGETLQRHTPFLGHERELYEDTIRVPLIISMPGTIPASGIRNENPRLIDLMPTMLDLLHIQGEYPTDGESVANLVMGGDENPEKAAARITSFETIPPSGHTYKLGFRQSDMKYFSDLKTGEEFLFNLSDDLLEMNNLAADAENATELEKFRELHAEWFKTKNPKMSADVQNMNPETIKQLKDLGYLR